MRALLLLVLVSGLLLSCGGPRKAVGFICQPAETSSGTQMLICVPFETSIHRLERKEILK